MKYILIFWLAVTAITAGCSSKSKDKDYKGISESLTLLKNSDEDGYIGNATLSEDLAKKKPFIRLTD